jgi:HAD superfamily hydrolase (TIGR01509 family)
MTFTAVIFDCDGVVVDSEGPSFSLLGQDLARHGLPLTGPQMQAMFLGGTVQGIFETCRDMGASLPDDWVQDFYARIYEILAKDTPLIPNILHVLNALDAAHIPYAIGSNGSPRKMEITLGQHAGLTGRFKGHIYSAQSLGKPKPAPDLYLHAARALGVDPMACVVVEDSANGAKAARAAGMRCMGYAPHGNAAALIAAGAEIFSDMKGLPALLGL